MSDVPQTGSPIQRHRRRAQMQQRRRAIVGTSLHTHIKLSLLQSSEVINGVGDLSLASSSDTMDAMNESTMTGKIRRNRRSIEGSPRSARHPRATTRRQRRGSGSATLQQEQGINKAKKKLRRDSSPTRVKKVASPTAIEENQVSFTSYTCRPQETSISSHRSRRINMCGYMEDPVTPSPPPPSPRSGSPFLSDSCRKNDNRKTNMGLVVPTRSTSPTPPPSSPTPSSSPPATPSPPSPSSSRSGPPKNDKTTTTMGLVVPTRSTSPTPPHSCPISSSSSSSSSSPATLMKREEQQDDEELTESTTSLSTSSSSSSHSSLVLLTPTKTPTSSPYKWKDKLKLMMIPTSISGTIVTDPKKKKKKSVQFHQDVTCVEIQSHKNYTHDERRATWYTRPDYLDIKIEALMLLEKLREGHDEEALDDDYSVRGLETWTCSPLRFKQIQHSISGVLKEQRRYQRLQRLLKESHKKINKRSSRRPVVVAANPEDIYDPFERLRTVYRLRTQTACDRAIYMGHQDHLDAQSSL